MPEDDGTGTDVFWGVPARPGRPAGGDVCAGEAGGVISREGVGATVTGAGADGARHCTGWGAAG